MKFDRLLGILTILLQNDRVTAPTLAAKFEVTRRTIGRDVDALCRAGIPIITHRGAGGGLSIAEGFKLDKSVLTTDELRSIIAAIKGLGSVSEETQIERTLDKLGANADAVIALNAPVVIDLASHYQGDLTQKIAAIKRAVLASQHISFDYFYQKGETRRTIEPYFVLFQWSAWYVFGFCVEKQDWRTFKLTRLWNISADPQTFAPRAVPPRRHDFNQHFTDENRLTALFHPSAKYLLIDTYGHDSFRETPDGLHFQVGYTHQDYILSWLLSFGDKVKVLSPPALAAEIKSTAKKILARYE